MTARPFFNRFLYSIKASVKPQSRVVTIAQRYPVAPDSSVPGKQRAEAMASARDQQSGLAGLCNRPLTRHIRRAAGQFHPVLGNEGLEQQINELHHRHRIAPDLVRPFLRSGGCPCP